MAKEMSEILSRLVQYNLGKYVSSQSHIFKLLVNIWTRTCCMNNILFPCMFSVREVSLHSHIEKDNNQCSCPSAFLWWNHWLFGLDSSLLVVLLCLTLAPSLLGEPFLSSWWHATPSRGAAAPWPGTTVPRWRGKSYFKDLYTTVHSLKATATP